MSRQRRHRHGSDALIRSGDLDARQQRRGTLTSPATLDGRRPVTVRSAAISAPGCRIPGVAVTPASYGVLAVWAPTCEERSRTASDRVEVEDRGLPSAAERNPGTLPSPRVVPEGERNGGRFASRVSHRAEPEQTFRPASISESGSLTSGDPKIAPETR
jgi:hypothetical protein